MKHLLEAIKVIINLINEVEASEARCEILFDPLKPIERISQSFIILTGILIAIWSMVVIN